MSELAHGKHAVIKVAAFLSVLLVGAFALSPWVGVRSASAQTTGPTFLMTWQVEGSYVPVGYADKALPNPTSAITASLEILSPSGKPINLSGQTIYWYLDSNLLGGGVGDQHVTFQPLGGAPNTLTLRAELPDYPSGDLLHQIIIPVVQPKAVIEAPYPQNGFPTNSVNVSVTPYFFNISLPSALSISWLVNGQPVSDAQNPQSLQVNLPADTPSGSTVAISVTQTNPADSMAATTEADLTYNPQL